MTQSNSGAIRSVLAAIRATPVALRQTGKGETQNVRPFVTISRQAGAGGHTIGQLLVNRLTELDPGETPWALWDRDLVEKIVTDHNVERDIVESLGEAHRSWMEEFLAGLAFDVAQTEGRVYQYVATTMRALAHQGRVVLVGRGSVYITRHLPAGVHLRLVAPIDHRIRAMAKQLNVSMDAAAANVHQLDKSRAAFYRRYWPRELLGGEAFSVTFNTAMVDERRAVESAVALILPRAQLRVDHRSALEAAVKQLS